VKERIGNPVTMASDGSVASGSLKRSGDLERAEKPPFKKPLQVQAKAFFKVEDFFFNFQTH
jgi:hypothetical protein